MRRPTIHHSVLCIMLLLLPAVEAFSSLATAAGFTGKISESALWNKQPVALRSTDINMDVDVEVVNSAATTRTTAAKTTAETESADPSSSSQQPSSPPKQSSRALESMLRNNDGMTIAAFFKSIWQQSPALFRNGSTQDRAETSQAEDGSSGSSGVWKDDQMQLQPYEELVQEGWHVLTDLLEQPIMARDPQTNEQQDPPLVIHNGNVQHPQEWMPAYGTTSLFAPYVNGSSVMQAHADCLSPWLAAFCQDLQHTFPYVYANTYLTPPHSRALNLHADDRDVFVVQLVGSKEWEVMQEVPIAYPYPHEQVGKGDLQVPPHVVEGGTSLSTTLQAGDVLYIPRGHCHHAKCTDDLSFHVTIAVATFDWTLAGMLHMASKSVLMNVNDYRKGILPMEALDEHNPREALQEQIDSAIDLLQKTITPEAVLNNLQARIEPHRQRATVQRERQLERARSMGIAQSNIAVGSLAAKHITLSTKVRAATGKDQEQLQELMGRAPGKLHVRDELAEDVSAILSQLQSDPALKPSVSDLKSLVSSASGPSPVWCDLAWLGFAKQAVELGELAVVDLADS